MCPTYTWGILSWFTLQLQSYSVKISFSKGSKCGMWITFYVMWSTPEYSLLKWSIIIGVKAVYSSYWGNVSCLNQTIVLVVVWNLYLRFGVMAVTKGLLVPSRPRDLSFNHCIQTNSCVVDTGRFWPWGWNRWNVKLTTHLRLMANLGM